MPDVFDTSAIEFRSARTNVVDGAEIAAAAAVDLDMDGDTDLVTSRPLSAHFNPGNGRFGPAISIDGSYALALAAADLDGDGDNDIVTGGDSAAPRVFFNLGAGTFGPPADIPLPFHPQLLTAADVDADGDVDVVAAGTESLAVMFNQGPAGFAVGPVVTTPFAYPARLFSDDFDRDGDLDILLGDTYLAVALNAGAGQLEEPQPIWEDGRGPAFASGDLDGDGDVDLVAGDSFARFVRIGLNQAGAVATTQRFGFTRDVVDLYLEDRDGDGDLDVVALAGGEVSLFRNLGDGRFEAAATAPVLWGRVAVASDFNGDRIPDTAVFSARGFIALLLGAPDGTFVSPAAAMTGHDPNSVTTGDFDADGDLDIAVANYSSNMVSVVHNLDGALSASTDVAAGEQPGGIASGDLDADGDIDLVVGHTDTGVPTPVNLVSVLSNAAGGHFTRTVDLAAGSAPDEVAIADLNGDTRPDILAGGGFNYVAVFLNQGGTFSARRELPIEGSSRSIAVGDLDGDGDLDLAVANGPYSHAITVLRNRGDATFSAEQLRIDAGEPVRVVLADIEPDGDLDIIALTFYGRIVVAVNSGSSDFADVVVNDLTVQASSLAVGDIDRDGDPDLALATTQGVIAVLRHSGAGIFRANDFLAGGATPVAVVLGELVGGAGVDLISVEADSDWVFVSANLTPPSTSEDCDADQIPDECQVAGNDCDDNAVPDNCQADADLDTVPDPCDLCASQDDRLDADADRRPDCADNCPAHANPDQTDTDGDILGDACDLCPTDGFKQEPGPCGCGQIELDRNHDGIVECSAGCACDCNRDQTVTVAELIRAVNIALSILPRDRCRAADANRDNVVEIAELVSGGQRAIFGCI